MSDIKFAGCAVMEGEMKILITNNGVAEYIDLDEEQVDCIGHAMLIYFGHTEVEGETLQ